MKKNINEYSIELDKILKEYESKLSDVEREEVISYINALEENLQIFKELMKNNKNLEDMLKHISHLGDNIWQEKN